MRWARSSNSGSLRARPCLCQAAMTRAISASSSPLSLLYGTAPAGDEAAVESAGGESAVEARRLDLETAIDHDVETGGVRARDRLVVDDAVLEPDRLGSDRDGFVDHGQDFARLAKDVDDVGRAMLGGVRGQRRIGFDAVDRGDGRVDRRDVEARARAEIGEDGIARAHRIGGRADHRDRVRAIEQVAPRRDGVEDHRATGCPSTTVASLPTLGMTSATAAFRAFSKSQIRSSASSNPTLRRIASGSTPLLFISSSESWAWVVLAGWMTSDLASPTLARWLHSSSASMKRLPASRPPTMPKVKIEPIAGSLIQATSGRSLRKATTFSVLRACSRMRSGNVSRPRSKSHASIGDIWAPTSRSTSARARIKNAYSPKVSVKVFW